MLKFIFLFLILFIWAFFIEPNLIISKKYKIDSLSNIKIIFVSDFHISKYDKKRLIKIVNFINRQNPDLVLSGGDFIKGHDGKITMPIEEQVKILKTINAPIITVLGNHDCWYDKKGVTEVLTRNNIQVLSNSNVHFKNIYIAGVEDLQTGKPDVETAIKGTQTPRILLTHSPDIYYEIADNIDLILAGHTHGGQIRLPFLPAPVVPSKYGSKFANGIIKDNKNIMIITRGLGTSILPFRFCSVPEIIIIN